MNTLKNIARKNTPTASELQDAATQWTQLRDGSGSEAQWLEWSAADARRVEAFARISELAGQLGALPPSARHELSAEFASARAPRRRLPLALAAGVALAAVAIGVFVLRQPRESSQVFVTPVAVDREIALPDGSRVALGGASRLQTHFAADLRQIDLSSGEAFFQVAHDRDRPFIVAAGAVSIRAVGTAFNVRRTGERVTIAVTEGRVRIAGSDDASMAKTSGADALEAVAGQQVSYDPHASGLAVVAISPAQATGWRDHRLEFLGEPLEVVVANINRYSDRSIELGDAQAGMLSFTGTVKPDALDGWLKALPKILPVRVTAEERRIRIDPVERSAH